MLEFLLANHPLDCPVCDKGGECPLQDQAFSHGPGESRFIEEKRHFEKPIPISSLVYLDRERCILCDRCTRFASEVAGDPLITFTHRGNNTQVLTFPDDPFASYFSGNTVQICPVGALHGEALPLPGPAVGPRADGEHVHDVLGRVPHHGAVEPEPSCCATRASTATRSTGAGCATRAGSASRPSPRPDRVTTPLVRQGDELVPVTWGAAIGGGRRCRPRRHRRRRPGVGRHRRRRPRHQRGRVRLGAAGP